MMRKNLKPLERIVLNKRPCMPESLPELFRRRVRVCSYKVNEQGLTELVPVCEGVAQRAVHDGRSLEIANLLYGSMPEQLEQVQVFDQMECADRITTMSVRRFGELSKQRAELSKKFNLEDVEE